MHVWLQRNVTLTTTVRISRGYCARSSYPVVHSSNVFSGSSFPSGGFYPNGAVGAALRVAVICIHLADGWFLWAHVLTSLVANSISLVIVAIVALLMGFRSGAGVLAWLAVAGIVILYTLALTWIAVIAGLSAKTVDGASAFSYPILFLPFISSAFVPTATMPGPVRAFAENQPVTSIVKRDPGSVCAVDCRWRHLGCAGVVCRDAGRCVCVRDGGLPQEDLLVPAR